MYVKMKAEVLIDISEEELKTFLESGDTKLLIEHVEGVSLEILDENDEDNFDIGVVDITDQFKDVVFNVREAIER